MKKYALIGLLALTMVLTYGASVGFAQDEAAEGGVKAEEPVAVTLTGVNYALLETLAKEEMATANTAYVSMNGLQVTEAKDIDGNELPDLAGQTLHYLPNKAGEPLFMGEQYKGSETKVIGKWYKKANALLVESFEAEATGGDEWDVIGVGGKSGIQVL